MGSLRHVGEIIGAYQGEIVLYFFEITNGTKCFKDHEGQQCRSRIAASVRAARIAAELAAEGDAYTEFAVRLLDAQGSELACVPVGSGRTSRRPPRYAA